MTKTLFSLTLISIEDINIYRFSKHYHLTIHLMGGAILKTKTGSRYINEFGEVIFAGNGGILQ